MRFSVDRTWRRPDNADAVVGGSPTRAFKLTPAGRGVVEAIERGDDVSTGVTGLIERLVDAGAIHPLANPSLHALNADNNTAVIPAYLSDSADGSRLSQLVRSLDGLGSIIVVDDASPLPLPTLDADSTVVRVVRRDVNGGPGAARNTGLESVETSHVVFVDSDVRCTTDDVVALAGWLVAANAAVMAPRVTTDDDGSALGAYEAARSPLDMGSRPARVRAGTRVGYVPAALLLCEVAALRAVNGFDESMRTGEDVDLVWRLDAAGHRCRYEPSIEVRHARRSSMVDTLRQRMGYGESTVPLHRRHGPAVAPARGSVTSVSAWAALALGYPIIAIVTALSTVVMLAKKLRFVPDAHREALRLTAVTQLNVGRNLASAITRVWWPIALVVALVSKRARLVLCAAAVVPSVAEWWEKRPRLDPVRYTLLRTVDDAAYGAGVWRASLRNPDAGAIIPAITVPASHND